MTPLSTEQDLAKELLNELHLVRLTRVGLDPATRGLLRRAYNEIERLALCETRLLEILRERHPVETPACPPELMGPRPCTGVYCEDEEREDLEAAWLEEHPPGSACTNGCGYCGRCT